MSYTVHKYNADGSYAGECFGVDKAAPEVVGLIVAPKHKYHKAKTKKGPRRKRVQAVVSELVYWVVTDQV